MWFQCDLDLRNKSSDVNIFVKNLSEDIDNKSLYNVYNHDSSFRQQPYQPPDQLNHGGQRRLLLAESDLKLVVR